MGEAVTIDGDVTLLLQSPPCATHGQAHWRTDLHDHAMAGEIFGTAALFWLLVPVGLIGGLVVLKFQGDNFEN